MTYTVFFKDESGKLFFDAFDSSTVGEARRDFKDCYRHGNYTIFKVLTNKEVRQEYVKLLETSKENQH